MGKLSKKKEKESVGRKGNACTRIQKAALACFMEKGYEGASVAEIARQAGVSPATIYLHFSGKQELFDSLNRPDLDFPAPRAQERRRAILQAALHVFGEKGYDGASMDDVAQATGLSKGALYGYFSGKDDLLAAVIENAPVFSLVEEALAVAPRSVDRSGELPAARTRDALAEVFMRQIALRYLRMFRDPDLIQFMRLMLAEGGKRSTISEVFNKVAIERGSTLIAEHLTHLGYDSQDELAQLVQAFIGMLFSWVLRHRFFASAAGDEAATAESDLLHEEKKMADRAVRLFLHGVG
jgi:TetR/AcrR family transcriptional repressor of mexJK operon